MDLGVCGRKLEKLKGKKGKMACSMDGCNDNDDIANIFSDKYMELYNSVPYDTSEMKSIESSVLSISYIEFIL